MQRPDPKQIFRKVALERMSSPEQLDQLLQVTSPPAWAALAILGGLLVIAIIWGFVGHLPQTITAQGLLVQANDGSLEVLAFAPLSEAQSLASGQEAQTTPFTTTSVSGFMRGSVRRVGTQALTQSDVTRIISQALPQSSNAAELASLLTPQDLVVEVRVQLTPDAQSPSGYQWSVGGGPQTAPAPGVPVQVVIIYKDERPIALLFPLFSTR